MQIPCVYLPGPAPAVSVANIRYTSSLENVLYTDTPPAPFWGGGWHSIIQTGAYSILLQYYYNTHCSSSFLDYWFGFWQHVLGLCPWFKLHMKLWCMSLTIDIWTARAHWGWYVGLPPRSCAPRCTYCHMLPMNMWTQSLWLYMYNCVLLTVHMCLGLQGCHRIGVCCHGFKAKQDIGEVGGNKKLVPNWHFQGSSKLISIIFWSIVVAFPYFASPMY